MSTRAPSLGRGCRAQRGGVGFLFCGEAASSLPSPSGKGARAAVDRVLSLMAHLRRSSSLSFIPLEPYPARSARHLPHAGKALSVVILFPYMRVFVLTIREYHLLKKRRSRHLTPEPNESKITRGCEEMRIHFFTALFLFSKKRQYFHP